MDLKEGDQKGLLVFMHFEGHVKVPCDTGFQYRPQGRVKCLGCGTEKLINASHFKQNLIKTCGELSCKRKLRLLKK